MVFLDTDFLESNEIKLLLEKTTEADPVKNYVPAYHFLICDRQGTVMGHCALRIGYNDSLYYAAKACKLLFLLAKKHGMSYLYITCNPDNLPSRRICEYLQGEFLGVADLPEDNDMRINKGKTQMCIFKFNL